VPIVRAQSQCANALQGSLAGVRLEDGLAERGKRNVTIYDSL
jgi:hypothetical protein